MTDRGNGNALAVVQLVVALGVGFGAWWIAPDLKTHTRHDEFFDFFASSAAVIAALIIALAVEARIAIRGMFLAIVTGATVAIGEVSAVAALSPSLPHWIYRPLFSITVGAGIGALVAAVAVGVQTLTERVDLARLEELGRAFEQAQKLRE